ncbi:MAG: hypothetical protein EOS10_31000 [Mesorhizobium sp.]|uniref:hypothetical protein n=1 Tax=Mesorhizobium sp. TaxID=1871066 RepID=UPI000FE7B6E4|nr:hypothetical protein [Mesorhizobium sp.]RWO25251.1 MAG: hypothetical protein EOS10_31000 [Mesorhizobium sp.]
MPEQPNGHDDEADGDDGEWYLSASDGSLEAFVHAYCKKHGIEDPDVVFLIAFRDEWDVAEAEAVEIIKRFAADHGERAP